MERTIFFKDQRTQLTKQILNLLMLTGLLVLAGPVYAQRTATVYLSEGPDTCHARQLANGDIQIFDPNTADATGCPVHNTVYSRSAFDRIQLEGLGSNDELVVAQNVTLPFVLLGGFGSDFLRGGAGNDTLLGNQGNDRLEGGPGNDLLQGGQNDDTIFGQEGNDSIYGLLGNDFLSGNSGNDFIAGGEGNDVLRGDAGRDSLFGENGSDIIDTGSDDDDTPYGGPGRDVHELNGDDEYLRDRPGDFNRSEGDYLLVNGVRFD